MYFRLEMMIGYIKQRITEYEVRRKAEFHWVRKEVKMAKIKENR